MRRKGEALTIIIVTLILIAVYVMVDPNKIAVFPKCLFKSITGFKCAACGLQRSIYSLLHGDLKEAIEYNAVFVASLPILAASIIPYKGKTMFQYVWQRIGGYTVIATIIIIIIGWTIIRNICQI